MNNISNKGTAKVAAARTNNFSDHERLNKTECKTSKGFTRAGSEDKSSPIIARPICRIRSNSMEPTRSFSMLKDIEINVPTVDINAMINTNHANKDVPTDKVKESTSQTENSIREEDEHLSDKENQPANITDNTPNKEVAVSNVLLQSPKRIAINTINKPIKHSDDEIDSSDNMQKLIIMNTESLSETPFKDSIGRNTSIIEIYDDSSSDENIEIVKCSDNVSDSESERSVSLDDKAKEVTREIICEDINEDKVVKIASVSEIENCVNTSKESEEICINRISVANNRCDINRDIRKSNILESVKDTNTINNSGTLSSIDTHRTSLSKSLNIQLEKESMSSITLIDKTDTNNLKDVKISNNVSTPESVIQESTDRLRLKNFESGNEKGDEVINNSQSSIVTDSSVRSTEVFIEKENTIQNICVQDNVSTSKKKSTHNSDLYNEAMKRNEILETFEIYKKKVNTDDNPDSNADVSLFQDIRADEWKENNSDKKNSLYSMLTEKLGDESENECDLLLVDKEAWQATEDTKKEKRKKSFDYDSDSAIVLKAQKTEETHILGDQCEVNETKSARMETPRQSMKREEVKNKNLINNFKDQSEESEKYRKTEAKKTQSAENVYTQKSEAEETVEESTMRNNTSAEKIEENKNLTIETEEDLNILSDDSSLDNTKLSDNVLKKRICLCKSVKMTDDETEESSGSETVEKKKSMNISRGSLLYDSSSSGKSDKSMDSDIEREYNLRGEEQSKFSDDDVPGDECRASETESSDPNDNGSDLADFVVNNDDISEEEEQKSRSDEELYDNQNIKDEKTAEDEQYRKVQNAKDFKRNGTIEGQRNKAMGGNSKSDVNKCSGTSVMKKGKSRKFINLDLSSHVVESVLKNKKKLEITTANKKMKKDLITNNDDGMIKENATKNRRKCKIKAEDFNKIEVSKKDVKRRSEDVTDNMSKILKKRKRLTHDGQEYPSRSMLDLTIIKNELYLIKDVISLSLYGSTTNFYVEDLQKLIKSKKTSGVASFEQETFYNDSPHCLSNYLMYLSKQRSYSERGSW